MTVRRTTLAGALAMAILSVPALPVLAQDRGVAPAETWLAAAAAARKLRMAEAPVTGSIQIRREGGRQVLVLSRDFKTNDQAPDLKVVFSPSANPLAATKPPHYPLKPGTYTILAPLKSSSGAQSYPIPDSIELKGQRSVLIWCQKFNATMAWAPLNP
ncbi:DM13 domain-containing protein [Cyanobium sp. FGCU-52]|nr:DM13 domain-containing protein [Cyanobium sp. FGCU52]